MVRRPPDLQRSEVSETSEVSEVSETSETGRCAFRIRTLALRADRNRRKRRRFVRRRSCSLPCDAIQCVRAAGRADAYAGLTRTSGTAEGLVLFERAECAQESQ